MNKLILLLTILALTLGLFATEVVIGDGTLTQRFPLGSYFGYERSAALYTATEIGAHNTRISAVSWFSSIATTAEVPTKIYLKTTGASTLTTDTWANMILGATLLYDQSFTGLAGNGWNLFTLTSTFDVDQGDNLMILVERNYGGSGASTPGGSSTGGAIYSTAVPGTHLTWNADQNPPTGTGNTSANRPNVTITYTTYAIDTPPNPAIVNNPADEAINVSTGTTLNWGSGGGAPTGYRMFLGTNNPPTNIVNNTDLGNVFSYTPASLIRGTTYYWQVVPYNANGSATGCPVWSFTTVPEGLAMIGDGTVTTLNLPINPYYGYNYSQTLYLQNEIDLAGQRIEKLYYHWNGLNEGSSCKDWTIYMGHTTQSDFPTTTDWVPFGNLTQVFEGEVDLPATDGWIEITLTMPFAYNNTDNLVIAVHETTPGNAGNSTKFFGTATDDYRGLRLQSDSITHDPASPASGTRVQGIANIRLQFGEAPTAPVLSVYPEAWDFGTQIINTIHPKQFTITNTGTGALNVSGINVTGEGFALAEPFTPVSLLFGENVSFTVNFVPLAAGDLTGNVVINDDRAVTNIPLSGECFDPTVTSFPLNESFDTVTVPALPLGWTSLSVSGGTANWASYASNSNSAPNSASIGYNSSLPLDDWLISPPINFESGSTYSVSFYYRGGSTSYVEKLKVMLGTSNQIADFTTQVFIDESINFTTYTRAFATFTVPSTGTYFLGWHAFSPTNQLRMYVDDIIIELRGANDLAATALTGNTSPSVGTATQYTVSVYNNGTAAQSTYEVKLYDENDVELDAAVGTATIAPEATVDVILNWTPTTEGVINIYGKVFLDGDINPVNNTTDPLMVTVMEEGLLVAEIGSGTTTNTNTGAPAPYGTWYRGFRQQLLYKADELFAAGAAPGLITALAFNVQNLDTCSPMTNYTIRLKLTDQEALTTTFELGDYTTVWQNDEFMPTTDWNTHSFSAPFLWDGASNLLVDISTDVFTGTLGRNALVYYTPTSFNSSLRYQSDSNNGSTGTTGSVIMNRSNIRFFMSVDGMGSLAGTVTASGSALADVEISIDDTIYHTITSASGQYNFPYVPEGDYTLSAHKIGYEDYSIPFTIVEDQETIVNISMTASASVNVTGTVVGSDNPTVGLSDGIINLTGVINYTANTNAAGQFVVENVLSGNTYNYSISRAGYQTDTGTIVVGSTDYAMGSITLNELTLPPSAITATVNDAETAVNLIWGSPGTPGNYYFFDFEFDDGDWEPSSDWGDLTGDWEYSDSYDIANWAPTYTGVNSNPPPTAHSGTGMWGTKINTNYTNSGGSNYLTKTLDFSGFSDTQLKFWSWENLFGDWDYAQVSINGTLVWGPSWDYQGTIWQERIIDLSAYDGMSDVVVQFEMFATTTVNYAGWYIDDVYIGPAGQDIVRNSPPSVIPSEFRGLSETQAADLAETTASLRPARKMANTPIQPAYNPARLPLGYKVWRLQVGQENTPALWTSLTPAMITDTTFVDPAWASFPDGMYKWAVKTIYTNNVESNAGFSNNVRKQPNDMSALSISGNTTPTVGSPTEYTVRIKNTGTSPQAAGAYSVKIMSAANELVSVPGPAIAVNQTIDFVVTWNPTAQGPIQIYGKVVLPEDSEPTNDQTLPITLLVMPAGQFAYTVGEGDQLNKIPINPYYKSSLFQMIIYPAELSNFLGFINGIQFYNNFVTDIPSLHTKIWFETTTLENLADGWVPITTGSTLVFDGNVSFPSGENTISIPFAEPFMYLNGDNLLITVQRPLDTVYYNTNDRFRCQTIGTNRARITQSDSIEYDPTAPPTAGTVSGQFPMTTLLGIPGGVGHLSGTVTTGAGNTPLEGVLVQIIDAGYEATTDAEGEYEIRYVLPDTYNVSFSRYGYITQTQVLVLEEEEEAVMNANMQPMPTVSVSGTIVASDTGSALAGASITLTGYANYTQSSTGNGSFTFPAVYANQSYEYIISCPGYTSTTGIIDVAATAYQMGTITLNEI
ncbi:MAG: carboxypeptidase regulatory-like domain-containing protein, partial [Candidatus Cloacimonetes bacterium]|nr:carboxypeptidase regulatory-like domain-containing protein [Candidatus Cloacimonadota bacterium]MDY0173298.1 carboxypeptidase regulatory-like domain-containing protein [Candidatus Cloacimonadaceae bacterium]